MLADIIIAVIIFCSIYTGAKKGFIRSVMSIATFFCSLIAAWCFYTPLAAVYNSLFIDKISADISKSLSAIVQGGLQLDLSALFAERPAAFTEILDRFHINIDSLESEYYSLIDRGTSELTETVSQSIARPVCSALSNVLAFLSIFLGCVIVLKIITLILDLIFKLPALNVVNRVGGIIFGIISGCFYALLISQIIRYLVPLLSAVSPGVFNPRTVDNSLLLGLLDSLGVNGFPVIEELCSIFGL